MDVLRVGSNYQLWRIVRYCSGKISNLNFDDQSEVTLASQRNFWKCVAQVCLKDQQQCLEAVKWVGGNSLFCWINNACLSLLENIYKHIKCFVLPKLFLFERATRFSFQIKIKNNFCVWGIRLFMFSRASRMDRAFSPFFLSVHRSSTSNLIYVTLRLVSVWVINIFRLKS